MSERQRKGDGQASKQWERARSGGPVHGNAQTVRGISHTPGVPANLRFTRFKSIPKREAAMSLIDSL